MYEKGFADHTAWQNWVEGYSGEFRAGIEWWASQRSISRPGSCEGTPLFTAGCNEARARLAPLDKLRKSDDDYKLGWNDCSGH
jgi:hypothetical protein